MRLVFNTNNNPTSYLVDMTTSEPSKMIIIARDAIKPFTFYYKQWYVVTGNRKITIMLPQTPQNLLIEVYNYKNGNLRNGEDITFKFGIKEMPLKTKLSVFDFKKPLVANFIKFAQRFSELAGVVCANKSIYCFDRFRINYYDVIRDLREYIIKDGKYIKNPSYMKELTTPARVNKTLGIIEISKKYFCQYTIPQRMIILLHEFSHFYYNKEKSNEEEADFNALLMYLGLGYPRIEALDIWVKVFLKADTNQNRERYTKIKNFINKFDDFNFKIL
jgi:hypothetical protein